MSSHDGLPDGRPSGTPLPSAPRPAERPPAAPCEPVVPRWLRYAVVWVAVLEAVCWWRGPSYGEAVEPRVLRQEEGFYVRDFFQEWGSARSYFDGEPVYTPVELTAERYLGVQRGSAGTCYIDLNAHPPPAVLLALPLGLLSFGDAFVVWNALSLGALAASAWLVLRQLRPRLSAWLLPPTAAVLIAGQPFWHQMVQGQLNLILLLLLTGAWAADRSGRSAWAGTLIGVATAVKLFPGLLVLYFVVRRRWRAAGWAAAAALGCTALTAAVLGPATYRSYFLEVLPHTSAFQTAWTNCSLTGLCFKLFSPDKKWPMVDIEPLVQSRALAYLSAAAAAAVVLAVFAALACRARSREAGDLAFTLAVVGMLLVSPITWDHYFLLLLLPIAVLGAGLPPLGVWRGVFWVGITVLSLSPYWLVSHVLTLLGAPYQPERGGWVATPLQTIAALSVHCYALIGFFALTAHLLSRADDAPAAEPTVAGFEVGENEKRTRLSGHTEPLRDAGIT
jgi:hypothetical protein